MANLITHPRRIVRANCSERQSEVHSISIENKWEVLVTLEVNKCSDVIPSKFKTVKFTIK